MRPFPTRPAALAALLAAALLLAPAPAPAGSRPNCVTACQEAANVCTRSCNEKTGVSVEGCQISCSKRYYQPCFRRCLETNEVPVVDPYEPPAKAPEPEPKRSRR